MGRDGWMPGVRWLVRGWMHTDGCREEVGMDEWMDVGWMSGWMDDWLAG